MSHRLIDIRTKKYIAKLRSVIDIALFLSLLPSIGVSQNPPKALTFFENGQPTRTGVDVGMFADSPTRMKLDLAGKWSYSIDGNEWNSISIPSAYDFTGRVTFQRTFQVKPEMLDRYVFTLVAYGINYQCEIWINGNFIGRHVGGYSSFVLPIQQGTLQVGSENVIKVVVDNELTPKTTLPLRQQVGGWRTYGGIFRDIYLLATPHLFINSVDVKSNLFNNAKSAKISVHGEIMEYSSRAQTESGSQHGFQVVVYNKLSGELVGRSRVTSFIPQLRKSVRVNAEVVVNTPKLWSPETPDLYIVSCQIVRLVDKETVLLDEYVLDHGVSNIHWQNATLYVNNNPILLKGVLWHEDHPRFASAMTYEALERDLALIKTLGANLIRFPYPPHPYMLNLCDRYGLLVMEEIPLVQVPAEILTTDHYRDLATTYLKEMVERDKHHVSILAWGIGNEFETNSSHACEYVNSMRNIIKSIDPRSVYYATRSAADPCFEYVDMIAVNNYQGEVKEFRDGLKQWKKQFPEKSIVITRYGKEVEPGNHNGYSDPLSLESQARYMMQSFDVIKETKVTGGVICSFNDWRTDRPALTTHAKDPYLQAMGLVTYEREKRIAFDVVRMVFNGEKVQAFPVGNYSSGAPIIYVLSGLVILISFAFLYNGNRRFRDCVNRSLFRTYNFFADVRDQRILTYSHSFFLAVVVSVTWATILSSIFTHYRDNLLLDNMLSQLMSDGLKESYIYLVWNPVDFILVISALIFVFLLVLSIVVRLFALMLKTRAYFYHAFSITMWSMLPCIVMIPVAMILYRLMEVEFYILPIFVFIAVISLWALFRLMKGISIIYDVFPLKVYMVGLIVITVCSMAIYGYLDMTRSTTTYVKYMVRTVRSSF
ncbi:MAG: beta galactosidase jelly roll domain-containing protein [Ignavibacteriae bacterium]|nr:beta galactosidase jelly roll domain-containing protein [Ignavibacteriota bacterium]